MLEINIPGRGEFQFQHLVCDVNGTLAQSGILLDGMATRLNRIRSVLTLHLLTTNMLGRQEIIDQQLGIKAVRINPKDEGRQKAEYINRLGAEQVIAIGQGANDAAMLKAARLGICILSPEGTAVEALLSADLLLPDIFSALDMLEQPLRIVADLRI